MDSLPAKRGNVSGGARDGGARWGRVGVPCSFSRRWARILSMTSWSSIHENFIREKGRCLGHPAGATAGAESALLAGKRYEPLEVALIATYAQEAVFEATAFEIRFKLSMDMSRQTFALKFQLLNQGG